MIIKNKIVCMDTLSEKMKFLLKKYVPENSELIFCENDQETEEHIASAKVLLTFTKGISKEWIKKADACKWIQKLGAGVNNIDIDEASKRGILVANAKGMNSRSVAEHAVLLMLSVFKHLIPAHNGIVYHGEWLKTGLRDFSYELSNKKVGLIGLGDIGKHVANLVKGFGCQVFYYDIARLSPEKEEDLEITFLDMDTILKSTDVVSLHVPLTKETYHLINKERLSLMKETAILINTCRGGVIDENSLYEALVNRKILGAGIDVFAHEPVSQHHKLASLENVVLTPHIGGGTVEAMEAVIKKSCSNINSFLINNHYENINDVINIEKINKVNH
ncbi:2-hydroxyacid dehydrogenase [Alkalihalobacillus sp. BA299]|uniref:2-hydroxyacid dehydrogenase n=1 Tax=Alkalihalobacillus sp. BA299 TaxID=2815938 RepID=UPI001ADA0649|nr:2-hydroxyacid dehydrogenase [Alkalihalobacillus sp. BA299]